MTRISVALLAYNAENDLPDLLDALLAQTRPPDELIAFDDRSSDATASLIEEFAARAPFPVVVRTNERRFGPIEGTEMTIAAASGDVIAIHDQADVWKPDKLERIDKSFASERGLFFSDGDFQGSTLWASAGFSPHEGLVPSLVAHPHISAGTIAFTADLRDLLLPIPHHVSLDMWLSLLPAMAGPFRSTPEPLLVRRHGSVVAPTSGALDAARSKASSKASDLHRQRRRAQADALASVVERYEARVPERSEVLDDMKQRIAHLEARGKLSDSRTKRVPIIVRELRSGRYNRYSAGVLSAVQDLLY